MKNLTMITGGARCGKSSFAEALATNANLSVYYLATMKVRTDDPEQLARLQKHRQRRPGTWTTVECGSSLTEAISRIPALPAVALIDCLSLEVTNLMLDAGGEQDPYSTAGHVEQRIDSLIQVMESRSELQFIVVTNETGWGIVPEHALARAFRDFLGMANQRLAKEAESVYLMCAGLNIRLKPQT